MRQRSVSDLRHLHGLSALRRDVRAATSELVVSIAPAQIKEWTKSTPEDWANESFQITESERARGSLARVQFDAHPSLAALGWPRL